MSSGRPKDIASVMYELARFMDTFDRMAEILYAQEGQAYVADDEIQNDLRLLGDWFVFHPAEAARIHTEVFGASA